MRYGSVVTDAPLAVTPRASDDPFANCLHYAKGICGACVAKCAGGAIDEHGHDKQKCSAYGRVVEREMACRAFCEALHGNARTVDGKQVMSYSVGCALCQFGVPCMDRNPTAD